MFLLVIKTILCSFCIGISFTHAIDYEELIYITLISSIMFFIVAFKDIVYLSKLNSKNNFNKFIIDSILK
jgi:hypothetical protein